MNFVNKTVVITGASSGIGKAVASLFAKNKANLIIIGSNELTLKQTTTVLSKLTTVHAIQADLRNTEDILSLSQKILAIAPQVDVLIHCAGVLHVGSFSEISTAMFNEQFQVNTFAPFVITQGLLSSLKEACGHIVFINSSATHHISQNNAIYAASKAALKALADGVRMEANPQVRVLSIYPGRVATPMQEKLFIKEGKKYMPEMLLQPEDIADTILSALSLSDSAEVTDISIRSKQK